MEYRRNQENMTKKKGSLVYNEERTKVESLRRKKRRMKLKSKGASTTIIEKFTASSSKSAKFA